MVRPSTIEVVQLLPTVERKKLGLRFRVRVRVLCLKVRGC
jgi:hypothetical protein